MTMNDELISGHSSAVCVCVCLGQMYITLFIALLLKTFLFVLFRLKRLNKSSLAIVIAFYSRFIYALTSLTTLNFRVKSKISLILDHT